MGRISSQKRKNYAINGDMQIAQRGTSFAAIATGTYSLDRYRYDKSGAMVHTLSQDTDVPTLAQAGYLFQNSLRLNLTTPDTSIASTEFCVIQQFIEGYNWANLAQKPFTVSFWVKATTSGIYCVSVSNSAADRSYVAEYTISAPNTWEYKTITITASPSAGTWNYTNGIGLQLRWVLASGSSFQTTAGTWQTGDFQSTSNQTNGVNTGATDFRITGVMINEGGPQLFKTFGEDFEKELSSCQRYYEKSYLIAHAPGTNQSGTETALFSGRANDTNQMVCAGGQFKVTKRVPPAINIYSYNGTLNAVAGHAATSDVAVTGASRGGIHGFETISASGTLVSGSNYWFCWTAYAEL